jgi:hypothetical protein
VLCVVGFEREGAFDELTAALTGEWCMPCRGGGGGGGGCLTALIAACVVCCWV